MQNASVNRTSEWPLTENPIQRCVQFALREATPRRGQNERRRHKRHPFPYPIRLFPVDVRGTACGDPIIVLGKHLSVQGLDFYYQHPIAHRRAIVSFGDNVGARTELLMDLTWCRFSEAGWYENGGRFLCTIKLPDAASINQFDTEVEAMMFPCSA